MHTHRQDRLQYTVPLSLVRSVITMNKLIVSQKCLTRNQIITAFSLSMIHSSHNNIQHSTDLFWVCTVFGKSRKSLNLKNKLSMPGKSGNNA